MDDQVQGKNAALSQEPVGIVLDEPDWTQPDGELLRLGDRRQNVMFIIA